MKKLTLILAISMSSILVSQDTYYSGHPYTVLGTNMALYNTQGTARYTGTGGVISTVGGDVSNANTNPAGIGMFSRTELEITPNLQINNTNSNMMHIVGLNVQNSVNNDKNSVNFTLNSVGAVFATRSDDKPLRSSNIVVAVNRTNNYNRTTPIYTVDNNGLSYANSLARELNYGYQTNKNAFPLNTYPTSDDYYNYGFREIAAYDGQLLYHDESKDEIVSPITGVVDQTGYKKISGGTNEFSVGWAGSINDKYYIGVTLGVPFVNYTSEFEIRESDVGLSNTAPSQSVGRFLQYSMGEYDNYSGTGINLKLGGMMKLTDNLKASLFFHTPTYYDITNTYQIGVATEYENSIIDRTSDKFTDEFTIITPLRAGGGLSYLFGKRGFIGAEYEYNNVASTIFTTDDISSENVISSAFTDYRKARHALRLGGELVVGPGRFRAGYNVMSSPYTSNIISRDGDLMMQSFSLGAGIRGEQVSVDVSYIKNQFRDYNTFYTTGNNSEVGISSWNSQNQVSVTLNYRLK